MGEASLTGLRGHSKKFDFNKLQVEFCHRGAEQE